MNREDVEYLCGETPCSGYLVYNEIVRERRPGILVVHAWKGQDDFAREKADALARLGYATFAVDLYGEGRQAESDEEALQLMLPLFLNRQLLRDRVCAAYDTLKQQRYVDVRRLGAIGFCFGGLTVLELLRSGVDIKSAVSFHGILGEAIGEHRAEKLPHGGPIKGSLLLLHGCNDPLVSEKDVVNVQKEMTDAGVDWQMNIYGHAVHAFTNPEAKDPATGLAFNDKANARSFRAMQDFFKETLQ